MPTKRTVLGPAGVLLALALGLSPASPLPSALTAGDRRAPRTGSRLATTSPDGTQPGGSVIRLATEAFDPLVRVPEVPAHLRAERPGHWLVQGHAPASGATRHALAAAGAEVLSYLPETTYLVRASAAAAGALAALPSVRWVGPYHPAYKLSPGLAGNSDGPVHIWTHRGEPAARLAEELPGLPGVRRAEAVSDRLVVADAAPAARDGIARLEKVEWMEPAPRYHLHNANALWVSDTGVRDVLGAAAPGRLDGAGQAAAVADTGVNYVPHDGVPAQQAFADCPPAGEAGAGCLLADYLQGQPGSDPEALRTVTASGARHRKMAAYLAVAGDSAPRTRDAAWHGTHVGGSVAADYPDAAGAYGTHSRESDGVAPAARLVYQDIEASGRLDLPDDPFHLFAQTYDLNGNGTYDPAEDARVHNNSYGSRPGLENTGQAARVDDFVVQHPDFLVVFSASNEGPGALTLAGGEQLAKNALISCASENGRQPLAAPDTLASFSSHGPTPDGRIKPDVCTPGQVILSPRGGTADDDHYLQGTSMSAPVLAGLATLVRQYFWDGLGPASGVGFAPGTRDPARRHNPSAALVRAVTVNSAQRMRGFYSGDNGEDRAQDGMWPSAGQGFGRVELEAALHFPGDRRTLFVADQGGAEAPGALDTGGVAEFPLDVAPGEPLAVTLAWTDPANGLATGTPTLVNDLDLEVTDPAGALYPGNEFTTQSPLFGPGGNPGAEEGESVARGLPDRVNNLEAVRLADPRPGRYTVRVRGSSVGLGPQGFALVASGRLATDTPRISFDAPKARPGTAATAYLLGTGLTGEAIDGFARVAPSVYRATVAVGGAEITVRAAGVEATLPVDATPPAVSGVEVESLSADLARVRWSTDEPSTGEAVLQTHAGARRVPDVAATDSFPGLTTPRVETKGTFLGVPVLSTRHEVLVSGLAPGVAYGYEIHSTDEAGNTGAGGGGRFTSTDAVFAPDALDIAQLRSADPATGRPVAGQEQQWGTSSQLFAGRFPTGTTPPIEVPLAVPVVGATSMTLFPAFMFRLPEGLDPGRITGASVQLFSGHDFVAEGDRPAYSLDLLTSGVEADWGPGTSYETVERAVADVHLVPEPTLHRGGNVAYTFAVACNDLGPLRGNLAGDPRGERALAFRLRAQSDATDSALSFDTGFGHRSRGLHLRPRLLLHLDGADPLPCAGAPAPAISHVLVDHVDDTSAVVTWRTDVPADSTVYFREAGATEWVPVGSPVRVTQHFVRIGGLRALGAYEFVVRSANCEGEASVDDNGGSAYALFPEAYEPPVITRVYAQPAAGRELVGWTTDQPSTSVVRYGVAPGALDREAGSPDRVAEHGVTLSDLTPCRIHYFVVESTNQGGKTARSQVFAFEPPPGEQAPIVTFDFDDGAQGWAPHPPGGSGGLTAPAPAASEPLNPTSWQHRAEPVFSGSPAMRTVLRDTVPGYSSGADVRLVSPPVALPPGPGLLRFREWYQLEGTDAVRVELSPDDGATWVVLRTSGAAQNEGFPQAGPAELPIDPALAGRPVRLAFRLVSDAAGEIPGGGWAIDDVAVLTPRCEDPAGSAQAQVAPTSPPAARAGEEPGPKGPRPPVAAGAASIGDLPSAEAPPGPASLAAGTASCGPPPPASLTPLPARPAAEPLLPPPLPASHTRRARSPARPSSRARRRGGQSTPCASPPTFWGRAAVQSTARRPQNAESGEERGRPESREGI